MVMKEKEGSSESESKVGEKLISDRNEDLEKNPDEKIGFHEKGIDFLRENSSSSAAAAADRAKMIAFDGSGSFASQVKNIYGNFSSQELTLSYLCDNSNKDVLGKNLFNGFVEINGGSYKGKDIMVSEDQNDDTNRCVERDFLQLNGNRGNLFKREAEDVENEVENREKKAKMETLNLSLALPDVSLSLAGSNRVQNGDFPARLRSNRSVQSLAPSNNNTLTSFSNDFTAASLSYSHSHAFSHNPSCSITRNSTENYEYSEGSHRRDCDQIWNCGEGTNGSVHSRFRPVGDGGVALANHGGGSFTLGNLATNRDSNNSIYKTTSSDNNSFFPSELPARPRLDTHSGDSKVKVSENSRGLQSLDGGRTQKLSRPERILREIVSESIPIMARIIQEIPQEMIDSIKEYLKNLIEMPERKDELASLQRKIERRSDISPEALSKSHKNQLEILVAIKMGLGSFVSSKYRVPTTELVEIFLLERCRNIACKRPLPVDDCDCKICSAKKGFCSECMCPVCLYFDCANNTCSWVGCDVCSHWCHAACGIQRNLIKPGPSLKGPSGTTEMQFHCLGCGHASEMFGFVKDVFMACAKEWSLETLIKELECVRKVFRGSEDIKGKELYVKADGMLIKLENKIISPSDVCSFMFQFFNSADGLYDFATLVGPSKNMTSQPNDVAARPPSTSLVPKSSFYNISSSNGRRDMLLVDHHQNEVNPSLTSDRIIEDEWSVKPTKKSGFDSLESVVRVKEAEVRMFQNRADEARREAENFKRMVTLQSEKLDEEYAEKLAKLCLLETEERRRKKLEELKILEDSHCDYYQMKMRMQAEIAGLLKRMEATKQLCV